MTALELDTIGQAASCRSNLFKSHGYQACIKMAHCFDLLTSFLLKLQIHHFIPPFQSSDCTCTCTLPGSMPPDTYFKYVTASCDFLLCQKILYKLCYLAILLSPGRDRPLVTDLVIVGLETTGTTKLMQLEGLTSAHCHH